MKTQNKKDYCYLADKSKLSVGNTVLHENKLHIITAIEKGGCVGESIESKDWWLSNATLFTNDKNKELID